MTYEGLEGVTLSMCGPMEYLCWARSGPSPRPPPDKSSSNPSLSVLGIEDPVTFQD